MKWVVDMHHAPPMTDEFGVLGELGTTSAFLRRHGFSPDLVSRAQLSSALRMAAEYSVDM